MGHCEDCCFWDRAKLGDGDKVPCTGTCVEVRVNQTWTGMTREGLGAGWGRVAVMTGERFGCIHFSPRALTPNE